MIDGHLGVTFDQEAGLWKSVILNKNVEPIVLPQFVPRDNGTCDFFTDVRFFDDSQFDRILAELREPTALSVETEVLRDKTPRMNTTLVRSARNVYLVRAADAESAEAMHRTPMVVSGAFAQSLSAPSGPRRATPFQPHVEMRLTIPFGDIERALAKVAINFVCKMVGPEIARADGLQGPAGLRPAALQRRELWVRVDHDPPRARTRSSRPSVGPSPSLGSTRCC